MRTTITSRQNSALLKISNGIRIHREGFLSTPAQAKILLKRPPFIISLAGIAVLSVFFSFPVFNQSAMGYFASIGKASPNIAFLEQPGQSAGQAVLEIPVRLKIPKINVDTALESVGLTPQGAVDVPKGPTNAGWFNLGPRPGEEGSSVIDGHFGWWKNGTAGVFNNLNKLHNGDKLYIEDENGETIAFVVREIRRFNPDEDASDIFTSNDGKAHLNLITCSGVWNKTQKTYSGRLIVFTDKETE